MEKEIFWRYEYTVLRYLYVNERFPKARGANVHVGGDVDRSVSILGCGGSVHKRYAASDARVRRRAPCARRPTARQTWSPRRPMRKPLGRSRRSRRQRRTRLRLSMRSGPWRESSGRLTKNVSSPSPSPDRANTRARVALLARQPAPENLALGPHQQLLTEDSPDPSVPPTRSAVDKRCGEIMKNAKDFAVMIRKQLKKEIVKIPKRCAPDAQTPRRRFTERYNHAIRDRRRSARRPGLTRASPHAPPREQIRSMPLKKFFEKHGDDLGEEMLTDVKVRLGSSPGCGEDPRAAAVSSPPRSRLATG